MCDFYSITNPSTSSLLHSFAQAFSLTPYHRRRHGYSSLIQIINPTSSVQFHTLLIQLFTHPPLPPLRDFESSLCYCCYAILAAAANHSSLRSAQLPPSLIEQL
ncbi:hypothetical protein QL285_018251 [Trifolium repens]|nr:hypothetical protein QL285_018251 [Trifolium repens]